MADLNLVDGSVRIIALQFRLKEHLVPPCIRREKGDTLVEQKLRTRVQTGVQFMEEGTHLSLSSIVGDLEKADYVLVDAFARSKPGADDRYEARFIFAQSERASVSDELDETVVAVLAQLCDENSWQARAYRNPFYENGEAVQGVFALSLNLGSRKPQGQGQEPRHALRILDGALQRTVIQQQEA